jgi:hypothetical protein
MSAAILVWSLTIAQAMLALAMACNAYRIVRGPRAQDRVLCLDAMYVNAMLRSSPSASAPAARFISRRRWRSQ